MLRCKTVAGVHKELLMIALAYNLVLLRAAQAQGIGVNRLSFIDALRRLCHVRAGEPLCPLIVLPPAPAASNPASATPTQTIPAHETAPRQPPQSLVTAMSCDLSLWHSSQGLFICRGCSLVVTKWTFKGHL